MLSDTGQKATCSAKTASLWVAVRRKCLRLAPVKAMEGEATLARRRILVPTRLRSYLARAGLHGRRLTLGMGRRGASSRR